MTDAVVDLRGVLIPQPGIGGLPALVWAKIDKSPDGCWEWTGRIDRYGYGQHLTTAGAARRKAWKAHRFVYHCLVGEIPAGLTLDHICRRTRCVNPSHLRPMTMSENSRRSSLSLPERTRCVSGRHSWVEENIRRSNTGSRSDQCRPCERESRVHGELPPDHPHPFSTRFLIKHTFEFCCANPSGDRRLCRCGLSEKNHAIHHPPGTPTVKENTADER